MHTTPSFSIPQPLDPSLLARYLAAIDLFVEACRNDSSKVAVRPATSEELEMFRSFGIRGPALELFSHAVVDIFDPDRHRLWPGAFFVDENKLYGPGYEICPMGLVVIGSSNCGDAYALDFASPPNVDGLPRVLLVDHERRYNTLADVFAHARIAAPGLIEFIIGASGDSLRKDYDLPKCT